MPKVSELEAELAYQMHMDGVPDPQCEYYFAKAIKRRWRADFAWPSLRLICEVEGATWSGAKGRHTSGAGFEADCRKYAEAALLGYLVLRVTGGMVKSGEALDLVKRAIAMRTTESEAA